MSNSLAIKAAIAYAATMHKDQKYGEDKPYLFHLKHVSDTLTEFGVTDEDMHVAAWLHDVVEDTEATVDQIKLMFGPRVADLVWRVTNEPGKNRKERHKNTYPKIKESKDAIQLKLADRIANVTMSLMDQDSLLGMYKKEYKEFRKILYTPGVHEDMWEALDELLE